MLKFTEFHNIFCVQLLDDPPEKPVMNLAAVISFETLIIQHLNLWQSHIPKSEQISAQ